MTYDDSTIDSMLSVASACVWDSFLACV